MVNKQSLELLMQLAPVVKKYKKSKVSQIMSKDNKYNRSDELTQQYVKLIDGGMPD